MASLVIAGCSLAVGVTGGLTDRKRPFSLLRLTGVPLGMLRRVVTLESAVPLIAIALLSAGAGFWRWSCSSDPSSAGRSGHRGSRTT